MVDQVFDVPLFHRFAMRANWSGAGTSISSGTLNRGIESRVHDRLGQPVSQAISSGTERAETGQLTERNG